MGFVNVWHASEYLQVSPLSWMELRRELEFFPNSNMLGRRNPLDITVYGAKNFR